MAILEIGSKVVVCAVHGNPPVEYLEHIGARGTIVAIDAGKPFPYTVKFSGINRQFVYNAPELKPLGVKYFGFKETDLE